MSIDNLIAEFDRNKSFTTESIELIQTNNQIGKRLVQHFRKNKHRDFAVHLLEQLTEIRKQPYPAGNEMDAATLMLSGYILGLHQNVEDSLKIWNTKMTDFDTLCGFDIQLVVFAGVENTVAYLKTQKSKEAEEALSYIDRCEKSGDFDDLEDYFSENELPWFI
nr:hypothetical protein [uncultured Flavobacterium sp.]